MIAMSLPVHDWQFWVATGVFALAVLWMLRGVLPRRMVPARLRKRRGEKRATLTISAKGRGDGE